jgi:uncharacterized PurR-regulated membrane protein YhhQ (DUF165 family)
LVIPRRAAPAALAAALVGSVLLANWLVTRYGLIPAGFGLLVPAGTYAAGLALGLRDALHETGGLRWVLAAIAAGAVLSGALGSGRIALASALAFGFSELADLAVYRPLRARRWRAAVVASNAAGALVDTVLFLAVAGLGVSAAAVGGQLLVKGVWMTLLALAVGQAVVVLHRRAVTA